MSRGRIAAGAVFVLVLLPPPLNAQAPPEGGSLRLNRDAWIDLVLSPGHSKNDRIVSLEWWKRDPNGRPERLSRWTLSGIRWPFDVDEDWGWLEIDREAATPDQKRVWFTLSDAEGGANHDSWLFTWREGDPSGAYLGSVLGSGLVVRPSPSGEFALVERTTHGGGVDWGLYDHARKMKARLDDRRKPNPVGKTDEDWEIAHYRWAPDGRLLLEKLKDYGPDAPWVELGSCHTGDTDLKWVPLSVEW